MRPAHAATARFIELSLLLAAASLPVLLTLQELRGPSPWIVGLTFLIAGNTAGLALLRCNISQRSPERTIYLLCALQWITAAFATIIEAFALYVTPIVILLPVVASIPVLSSRRFRQLSLTATGIIIMVSLVGLLSDGAGNLHPLSTRTDRDVVAIMYVPTLVAFASYISWRNHADLWRQNDTVAASQRKLAQAAELGRYQLKHDLMRLQHRILRSRRRVDELLGGGLASGAVPATAGALVSEVQETAAELRRVSHGVSRPELAQHGLDHALRAIPSRTPWPVTVVVDSDADIDDAVESTMLSCAIDAVGATYSEASAVRSTEIRLTAEKGLVQLLVVHELCLPQTYPQRESTFNSIEDRVGALGGAIEIERVPLRASTQISIPVQQTIEEHGHSPSVVQSLPEALRHAVFFPLAGLGVCLALYWTIFPYAEMWDVVLLTAVAFTGPCLVALAMARYWPYLSLLLFNMAHWVIAVLIVQKFDFVKYFTALALLIPLTLSLPYVSRMQYAAISVLTCAIAGANTSIARLGSPLAIANESPDAVNSAIGVLLISLAATLVLDAARRNHTRLQLVSRDLQLSRRRVVRLSDRFRRSLERDLHDGVQQRILSAALRLQVAAHLDGRAHADIERNLHLAESELRVAERAVVDLALGSGLEQLAQGGIRSAIAGLAESSAFPVSVDIDELPDRLPTHVESVLFYCCSEALANVGKHAGPNISAAVAIKHHDAELELSISDDGVGFDTSQQRGTGLDNLRDRIQSLGGTLVIESPSWGGSGTRLTGRIPLPTTANAKAMPIDP